MSHIHKINHDHCSKENPTRNTIATYVAVSDIKKGYLVKHERDGVSAYKKALNDFFLKYIYE